MKNEKLSNMSNEELLKFNKTTKGATYALAFMIFLLFCASLFLAFKKGFGALNVVPLALLPIVLINFNTLKEIKKELISRNLL